MTKKSMLWLRLLLSLRFIIQLISIVIIQIIPIIIITTMIIIIPNLLIIIIITIMINIIPLISSLSSPSSLSSSSSSFSLSSPSSPQHHYWYHHCCHHPPPHLYVLKNWLDKQTTDTDFLSKEYHIHLMATKPPIQYIEEEKQQMTNVLPSWMLLLQ